MTPYSGYLQWPRLSFYKGNQGALHEGAQGYFDDPVLRPACAYTANVEKARGGIEKREYRQTDGTGWLNQKKGRAGLKTIAMTGNTVTRDGETATEQRYFISSLPAEVKEAARAIRGHWTAESCHWHLGVTFREGANHTADKQGAYNLNIMTNPAASTKLDPQNYDIHSL